MRHLGWFKRGLPPPCCRKPGARRPLNECGVGEKGIVISNADHRTTEMGFSHGTRLEVVRNDPGDESMVVVVGESRFAIPKDAAAHVTICFGGEGRHRRRRQHRRCSDFHE